MTNPKRQNTAASAAYWPLVKNPLGQYQKYLLTLGLLTLCLMMSPAIWAQPSSADEQPQWQSLKGTIIRVGDPYVDVYISPGRAYARFHVVEKNQQMRLFKYRTGWYKVETEDGKIGWVRQKDLKTAYDSDGYLLDFALPNWEDAQDPIQFGLQVSTLNEFIGYTVQLGYRFTPNISTEARYSQGFGESSNIKLGTLNIVHQPFPHWRYSPFFTLGAGVLQTFPEAVLVDAEDERDSVVSVGVGLKIYLSYKVVARIEYNHHYMLTTRAFNEEVEEWKAGFSVLF